MESKSKFVQREKSITRNLNGDQTIEEMPEQTEGTAGRTEGAVGQTEEEIEIQEIETSNRTLETETGLVMNVEILISHSEQNVTDVKNLRDQEVIKTSGQIVIQGIGEKCREEQEIGIVLVVTKPILLEIMSVSTVVSRSESADLSKEGITEKGKTHLAFIVQNMVEDVRGINDERRK